MVGGRSALPQHVGSDMCFLTQEAWANKASIHLLSLLYCNPIHDKWDSSSYSEPLLFSKIQSVTKTFILSDANDGAAMDLATLFMILIPIAQLLQVSLSVYYLLFLNFLQNNLLSTLMKYILY